MKSRAMHFGEAFLAWARRSAIPLPGSHEQPLSEDARASLGRMIEGKRFVFLGEPEHCVVEKYPFRLTLIRYLSEHGWRHISMETGQSTGWRVDRYLETGDASWLRALGYEAFSRLTRCPMDIGIQDGSVGSHLHKRFPEQILSIWMLYGRGTLMMPKGPRSVRLHGDTIESLLAQVGDRFLLPLNDIDPQAKVILSNANLRSSWGSYACANLNAQADAIYFAKHVNAEKKVGTTESRYA